MAKSLPHIPMDVESDALPPLPLPAPILAVLAPWLSVLVAWCSALVYVEYIRRHRDHPLVQLKARYEVTTAVERCAAYYHASGPGAPPRFGVRLLLYAELVRRRPQG